MRFEREHPVVERPNQERGYARGGDALDGVLEPREGEGEDAAEERVMRGGVVLEVGVHLCVWFLFGCGGLGD